jgi:uncharacterized protein YggT (Ycf19 family)
MIIRVFLSLVGASPYNPLVLVVYGTTEPLLSPLRGLLPKGPGGLDLRALLFLAFLLLFYAFVLVTLIKLTNVWVLSYYALDTITM